MFNRYFVVSGGLHLLLAGLMLLVMAPAVKKPVAMYTIDFLGDSFQTQSGGAAAAPAAQTPAKEDVPAPKPAEPAKAEPAKTEPAKATPAPAADKKAYAAKSEITTKPKPKKNEKIVLGTPSILADDDKKKTPAQPAAASNSAGAGAGSGGIGGIKTDFPNFPYPWYITQVRNALWTEWEKRKPRGAVLECLVSFSIQQNGSIKDVQITKASSNSAYDYAAKSSVESAAPFPPLPKDFPKTDLTVTVEFRDTSN
ncbi:protein TonB [Elusimicrobium posterum]|uniref:energy transducer TonB n=1 Tax=Elusimicrobium posterum TaxID=3116653 RepID=UPI003C739885